MRRNLKTARRPSPRLLFRPAVVEAVEARRLMATIAVTNNNDAGAGSLRNALAAANANDTVDLTGRRGTITLASPLVISKAVTLTGPGVDLLTISGGDATSGLGTFNGSRIAVSDLTLAHFTRLGADNGSAGALFSTTTAGAQFTLDHVNFTNNTVVTTAASFAPAITMAVAGDVIMVDCAVTLNAGTGNGGGVLVQGGTFTALRCTFANNTSAGGGAGLLLSGDTRDRLGNCTIANNVVNGRGSNAYGAGMVCDPNGPLTMINCTVVNNSAVDATDVFGGGLYVMLPSGGASRSATLNNTIVAGNANGTHGDVYTTSGIPLQASYSLIGDGSNSGLADGINNNQIGTHAGPIDARVGPLADYGGATPTVPLLPGSPAIDAGVATSTLSTVPTTDQRGFARLGAIDIGALEARPGPPTFTSTPATAAVGGVAYSTTITSFDPNGDPVALTAGALPVWLTLVDHGDGSATLAGTPTNADIGTASIVLTASDGSLSTQQSFDIAVAHSPAAPTFTSTPVTQATGGTAYAYAVAATDANGDPLTITATTKPAWLTLVDHGDGTAILSGAPTDANAGTAAVTLAVTDGMSTTTQNFTLSVDRSPAAPVFGGTPGTNATVGLQYSNAFTATDSNNDALTFAATTKPAWLSFTDNGNGTATLVGVPAAGDVGPASVVVTVSDGTYTTTQSYTLTVAAANRPPAFVGVSLPNATVGVAYSRTVTASDADGDALALSATGLPAWLNMTDHGDGTATLAGTPTSADLGPVQLSFGVSDGHTTRSVSTGFTVYPKVPAYPTFEAVPPREAFGGVPYTATVTAHDANGDPLTLTLAEGPAWLTLVDHGDGTATLSGTPAAADWGLPRVRVVASNGVRSSTQQYEMTVAMFAGFAGLGPNGELLVAGTDGDDTVVVWRRGDTVRAIRGNDSLNFSAAAVSVVEFAGFAGDDVFTTNVGDLRVFADGGAGDDTLVGSAGQDTLQGGDGDDVIDGAAGRDSIYGGAGDDRLAGNADADTLFGGDGRDVLDGGLGRDLLRGEGGRDLFFAADGYGDRVMGGGAAGDRGWFDRRDVIADVEKLVA